MAVWLCVCVCMFTMWSNTFFFFPFDIGASLVANSAFIWMEFAGFTTVVTLFYILAPRDTVSWPTRAIFHGGRNRSIVTLLLIQKSCFHRLWILGIKNSIKWSARCYFNGWFDKLWYWQKRSHTHTPKLTQHWPTKNDKNYNAVLYSGEAWTLRSPKTRALLIFQKYLDMVECFFSKVCMEN